jgi:aconitate hydratase
MKGLAEAKKVIVTPMGKYNYYSLKELGEDVRIEEFPFSVRILIENIVRNFDNTGFTKTHLKNILNWNPKPAQNDIPFLPARVLMQDFTGVPSIVDIASLRSEAARLKINPGLINPQVPVDLIIDHSVQVDLYGTSYAYKQNVELEYERNSERYSLLKWAGSSFENFNVLPPGMGICHQINLEYLAKVVAVRDGIIFPDTLVGTDSHTPMVNGIGVLGWGVGGIEAEAVMLGQPEYVMLPEVIGLKLTGKLMEGVTATDMVLSVAELLRARGVVGKFVEVFGSGLDNLTVPDRATISNMSPEFGCTVTYFPPDQRTLEYLRITGRDRKHISTVEKYLKENLLWRENEDKIQYTEVLDLNLSRIEPSISGPKRPQDKIILPAVKNRFIEILKSSYNREYVSIEERAKGVISDGSIVIAAITSCTNTSNPSVMIGAGLLARKAVDRGLMTKPWVKTSLAPGSKVVTDYLEKAGLLPYLEALGFYTVGYGCTTCIGNSGPLPDDVNKAIFENKLIVASILSGNRNFEARIHPDVKMNFLASPPLVVAFAISGRIDINLQKDPLGLDHNKMPVYLRDIWPSDEEIQTVVNEVVNSIDFINNYRTIFDGDENWNSLESVKSGIYKWDINSTYLQEAPFFKDSSTAPGRVADIKSARVLLKLGDSVTTDHISPAGYIPENSPAGQYLKSKGVNQDDFNSYGSRRGNHEVMVRGTFANLRLKNELVSQEGGWTVYHPDGLLMTVFDAAMKYKTEEIPLLILAGRDYGSGSSRDWAAKGVSLLGVSVIIAESFERIHRSNLIGMGVLPLQFKYGENRLSLGLQGDETYDILNLEDITPNCEINVRVKRTDGYELEFTAIARLDSEMEIAYYRNKGILQYVLRNLMKQNLH